MVGTFYRTPRADIGSATGAFLVMVVQGHPVLHAQYVESNGFSPSEGRYENLDWREVTLEDMSLYGAKQEELACAAAAAEMRAYRARRSARFSWLIGALILVFAFAHRLGAI